MRNLFACAALALALPSLPLQAANAKPTPAPDALTPLFIKIKQRIDIGEEVALSTWYSGKPMQDTDRERQVIADATFVPYSKDVHCPPWVKTVTERQVTDPVVAIAMLRAAGELCTSSRKGNRS
jgi:chorismate mutase